MGKETEEVKKQESKPTDQTKQGGSATTNKKAPKKEELSEEDQRKKDQLDTLVVSVVENEGGVQKLALEQMRSEIKSSTTSMTSVPKPLKFLRPHYETLKKRFDSTTGENKAVLSDVLSVLAMTMAKPESRESLKFKLSGTKEALTSWGHEYVKNLAGEIASEWDVRKTENDSANVADLTSLIDEIVPYDMKHNAEHEAADLLLEVGLIDTIVQHTDEANYSRVCLYLTQCAGFLPEPEDTNILKVTFQIYKKFQQWPLALRVALRLNDVNYVKEAYTSVTDEATKKQLAFMLSRHHLHIEEADENADQINNTNLSEYFLALGQDLDIMEAKTPEDIYKSSNENRGYAANVDSARQNLASTFVNAFVNSGFGQDKFMTEDGSKWIYKNKEHGMMSAAASLGMILLWDVDNGLTQIDKYLYATEDYIKAGALLAVGIVNSGVRNEVDPALALLTDYVENKNSNIRIGALLGLGLAYVGSQREDLLSLFTPVIEDTSLSMEVVSIAALSLGLIFVGSGHPELTQTLTMALMDRDESSLNVTYSKLFTLSLGLLYLSKQGAADVVLETLKTIEHPIAKYAVVTVETCAYAGSGNVLKIQKLLDMCGDHLEDKNVHQAAAVLGIALISMGEEIGSDMAIRSFDHLLQYGEPVIRRSVPLALGLLSLSNPRIHVMDTLSKLSHDADEEVALGAIFGLGLIGAGTNNARVAGLLRGLASYYYKDPNHLFMVRIAQGFLYMGKGTITIQPYHSDRLLLSPVAMAGLLATLHSCLDLKNIILSKSHYLLYCLVTAMYPRFLMTFDENMKPLPVSVRVGQAVDTIGQAGKPKTITGFQTHTTPVLLGWNDRAELATDEHLPITPILEGLVILRVNPDAPPKEKEEKKEQKSKLELQ